MAKPVAPANVTLATTSVTGRIKVSWTWSAAEAKTAEISWADDAGAWASTSAPSSYTIERKKTAWFIDDLTTGKTWYVRVRLINGDSKGAWSATKSIALPATPGAAPKNFRLEAGATKGRVIARWGWNWSDATEMEVTWSDSAYAWQSAAGYQSSKTGEKRNNWRIDGLTTGKTWYVRIRFLAGSTPGPWSDILDINLPATVKEVATKKPTGITGVRDGNKIAFTWKIADENYGQAQWRSTALNGKWTPVEIGKTATSYTYTLPLTNYYPYTKTKLTTVGFAVKGRRSNYTIQNGAETINYKPQMSEWTKKEWTYSVPPVPTITATLDGDHATDFTWEAKISTTDTKPFANCEWQSILVRECTEKDGSKLTWKTTTLGWQTGTGGATGTKKVTEDTEILTTASYTRWFRIRSRGCAGDSAWRYSKHVYAKPKQASIKKASAVNNNAGGYTASVTWEATANASHPIDNTTVEYALVIPGVNLEYPTGESWTLAGTSYDTGGNDARSWPIDDVLDLDECLYYRVNTHHDGNDTLGKATLVKKGNLKDPTNITFTLPQSGNTLTISADNESEVPDSFLVVLYRREGKNDLICGIIPHGSTNTVVTVPDWTGETAVSFGAYAAQGTYKQVARTDGITQYTVSTNMKSVSTIWGAGDIPKAPENLEISETDVAGKVRVEWDWTWESAVKAEISWAENLDAWESTEQPQTFTIEQRTSKWFVEGLEMGKTWYIRVRLSTDEITGPWSTIGSIDLATTPDKPILTLSDGIITIGGSLTCSWTYSSGDGSLQSYAEVVRATIDGDVITYGDVLGHTETSQALILYAETAGWEAGEEYSLAVRTVSGTGRISEWSDPVTVGIAEPLTATIVSSSLTDVTIIDDEDNERTVLSLTSMPMTVLVTGAGAGGITGVTLERAESYHMDRPDEDTFNGYEGEAVAVYNQTGETLITITNDMLIGQLDDGARYRIVATVQDGLGQSASTEEEFEVHWTHQALMPQATIEIDDESYVALITPIMPDGALSTDVCDIYRLSADKPELIVRGGTWDEVYVDPYPAIGEFGGHRIVLRTANDDYITEDNQPAWIDLREEVGDILELDKTIIDFGGRRALLAWNMDISSSWSKDFTETHYLGGSVQGDWNAAVGRTATVGAVAVSYEDQELITTMRRLATYPGICHVRTPEGSSYAADVQVSEDMSHSTAAKVVNFSVSITRVDPEGYDGVLLSEWETSEEE